MTLLHPSLIRNYPITVRLGLTVGVGILHALMFSQLYFIAGDGLGALIILSVLAGGWLLGSRLGLVTGFLAGLLNISLYFFVAEAGSADILGRSLPSLIVGTIGGGMSGWVSDLLYQLQVQTDNLVQERKTMQAEIVQRQQTEAELRRQQEILQKLSDHLPLMIAFYDSAGEVLFLSRELERTLGWSMAELSEIDLLAECYPDPAYRQKVIEFMIAANEEWRDFKTRTKDDHLIDTSWFNVRLSDGSNIGIGQDITHRKQTEIALRQIQERYKLATQAAGVGIWDWNAQTNEFYIDPRVKALLGYSDEEIPNDLGAWTDHIHPDNRQAVMAAARAHLEGQTPEYVFEHRMIHKDGSDRWILVRGTAIRDDQGQVVRFLGTNTDITHLKQAEEALRESEEQFRLLFELGPTGIAVCATDGQILKVNQTFCDTLGYTAAELKSFKFMDFTHPDDIDRNLALDSQLLQGQIQDFQMEKRYIGRQGNVVPVILKVSLVRDREGQPSHFIGHVIDITERKRAEVELRESEEKWRSLVENAPDFILIVNPDLTIQFINRTVPGMTVEEVIGTDVELYIAPDHWGLVKERLERAFQTGEPDSYEILSPDPGGTMRWYATRVGPLKSQGQVTAVMLISLDITEQKQNEETLAYARDQALEASRLKSELLAKVSHELRTPLNAILGFAELLDFGLYGSLADSQKSAVSQVIESTHYLTKLVNELLDQAQLDAGHIELNLTTFKTNSLLEEVQTKMSVLAEAKGLQLTTTIAETMPDILLSDRQSIQKILFNLIGNAIKFTDRGEIQVNLDCPNAEHWQIEIRDTGAGIPNHALTKIFEPFQQVDGSPTRKHSGSGLGLSIVKQLAELMGGSITVESEFGQGSIFTVRLPMHQIMETNNA